MMLKGGDLLYSETSPGGVLLYSRSSPVRTPGFKSRIRPPNPQRVVKGDLMGRCWNHRIKRLVPCRYRTGTLKNPVKCLWRWEPDRRYNFFSPPAHRCRHIYY